MRPQANRTCSRFTRMPFTSCYRHLRCACRANAASPSRGSRGCPTKVPPPRTRSVRSLLLSRQFPQSNHRQKAAKEDDRRSCFHGQTTRRRFAVGVARVRAARRAVCRAVCRAESLHPPPAVPPPARAARAAAGRAAPAAPANKHARTHRRRALLYSQSSGGLEKRRPRSAYSDFCAFCQATVYNM